MTSSIFLKIQVQHDIVRNKSDSSFTKLMYQFKSLELCIDVSKIILCNILLHRKLLPVRQERLDVDCLIFHRKQTQTWKQSGILPNARIISNCCIMCKRQATYWLKIKHINDKIGLKINVITNISIHSFLATVDVKRIACRVLGSTKKKLCWYSVGHCGQKNLHFEPCWPSIPCQAITTQVHVAKLNFFIWKFGK